MNNSKREQDWAKKRLQEVIKDTVTKFFETVLDFSEVAVGDDKRYKALRSKVLRHGNDTIRNLNAMLDADYEITYLKLSTDEVRILNRKQGEEKDGK